MVPIISVRNHSNILLELRHFILFVQPGTFDLVGTIIYEIDQNPYQSTFYNGTIEVVEAGNVLSIESVFLVTLGIALLFLLGIWIRGQLKNLSKVCTSNPAVCIIMSYLILNIGSHLLASIAILQSDNANHVLIQTCS
jgi:hypothetical protein